MAKKPMTFRFSNETIKQLKYLQEHWGISGVETVVKSLHLTQTAIKRIKNRKLEANQSQREVYAPAIQLKTLYTTPSLTDFVKKKTLGIFRRN